MEEVYQELIEAKLTLAETNEALLLKTQQVRQMTEIHLKQQEEIKKMQNEAQSLYDSISQMSEERDLLLQLIQDSPRAFTIQSLDQEADKFIEQNYSQSGHNLWKAISENWAKVKSSKKLKKLSRKGIHCSFRGAIWVKAIENKLFINEKLFTSLVVKRKNFDLPSDLRRNLQQEQVESLNNLLSTFFTYRPDFQYSQSLSHLALVFISFLNDFEAFLFFSNFLNNFDLIRNFFLGNISTIQSYFKVIEFYLAKLAPGMLEKFEELGAYVDGTIMESISCFFARCAPVEYVSRFIDSALFEDEMFLIKLSLAVFACLEENLPDKDLNVITQALNNLHLWVKDPEVILSKAQKIKIDLNKVGSIRASVRNRASAAF